jgi:hypothetical protein
MGLKPYQEQERVTETAVGVGRPLENGDVPIQIIAHGPTRDRKRYYRREALEAAVTAGHYDGAKMYLNHRDAVAEARRGHRDVREWVSTIKPGSVVARDGVLHAVAHVHDPVFLGVLQDPVARENIGISQDSTTKFYPRIIDGTPMHVVESIEKVHSVDWVPEGNAWGRVAEAYAEAAQDTEAAEEVAMADLTTLTLDVLEVERPDLVEALTERVRETATSERAFESWGGLSADAVRELVDAAIRAALGVTAEEPERIWVREVYEDYAIVTRSGTNYRYPFTIVNGACVLGEAVVEVRQEWVPMHTTEALGDANTTDEEEVAMTEERVVPMDAEPEVAPEVPAKTVEPTPEVPADEAMPTTEASSEAAKDAEIAKLREQVARMQMSEALRDAVAAAPDLTAASKARVLEMLSSGPVLEGEALSARIEEACAMERAHEAAVVQQRGLGTRVRGLGASLPGRGTREVAKTEEAREAARAAFIADAKARGLDDAQIKRLAEAR